jgi:hypothetical protein
MSKKFVLLTVLSLVAVFLASGMVFAAPPEKVDICHREGNGSYHKINVSKNAEDAHLAHGDAHPGDPVPGMEGYEFDEDCNVVQALETTTVTSAVLNFSGTGWGGWSCPNVASHTLYLWEPGATTGTVTYPNTPFGYTYGTGETGAIVQNGGTPQNAQIVLTCQEAP